jgi:hypothetical protein
VRVVGWTLAGLVLGAASVILVAGIILPSLIEIDQREGAYAMAVVFFMAPAGATIGAAVGLVAALIRRT